MIDLRFTTGQQVQSLVKQLYKKLGKDVLVVMTFGYDSEFDLEIIEVSPESVEKDVDTGLE